MKNKYFVYAVINILIFIAYIYSTYFYFLVIWAISILFPLMLFILLKLEARYIQLDLHGQKQGEVGKRLSFVSEITSQYRLLVSGRIEYDFVYENNTLQSQIRKRIFIPLQRRRTAAVPFHHMMRNQDLCCRKVRIFNMVDHLGGGFGTQLERIDIHRSKLGRSQPCK